MSSDATGPEPQEQAAPAVESAPVVSEAAPAGAGLLDEIFQATRAKSLEQQKYERDLIDEFVGQIMANQMTVSQDTEAMINARIAQIDALLSAQLNAIMHHPDFQKLEGSWRGLHKLVHDSETGENIQIRVLNASKKDLLNDMERSSEFDQSALFKLVYTAEYDLYGGKPYGALVGDYEFGKHPQDIDLLGRIAQVAAAAHAPFMAAASAEMFGLDSFTDIGKLRALEEIFRSNEAGYIKWRSFRDHPDSRYVALCLPHTLMRVPYGPDYKPVAAFNFREDVDGKEHDKFLWGNAAYALGGRLTESFAKYGWCQMIRGPENGGLVLDLPTFSFRTEEGEIVPKCPTEVAISDRRENELARLGFVPLLHCKDTDYAAFFSAQSAQKPEKYIADQATASARLSTQIPYLLMVSRFAHYLKSMMRDRIGSFMSREECELQLNQWISLYVLDMDVADQEHKRKQPLRAARIDVEDDPRAPGCYRAVCYLRPHYMLDELSIGLRLVSELPPPRGT